MEATYAGAGLEGNWQAMFNTIDLFRRIAIQVGQALGYAYPFEMDRRSLVYYEKVRHLDCKAKRFE